ncbi:LDAH isoform 8 [Pan troglodytes]|uniref:Lipid droplet associated hydrolase n=2 Tax=Pan troglodytes TaxID=9598 RepID=A0A2I3RVL3_PANTR|nr:LDAH isoform 8 [Pan troglodytes]
MDSELKEEIPVHEEFILCGGAETQVLKCGPWTDLFHDQSVRRPKLLIFIIPGNPGFSAFYVPFAKALYSLTNRRFPVWTISHAGHAVAPKDKKILTTSEGGILAVLSWWTQEASPLGTLVGSTLMTPSNPNYFPKTPLHLLIAFGHRVSPMDLGAI